jgi:hypothetical protein
VCVSGVERKEGGGGGGGGKGGGGKGGICGMGRPGLFWMWALHWPKSIA